MRSSMRFLSRHGRQDDPPTQPRDTYTVVVHAEEGGYWAEVPELPGCASQGVTIDELLANIVDAIQGCLAVHLEDEGPHVRHNVFTMNVPVDYPSDAVPA
jgi:predicted RNase H-like HicB family nuclease